MTLEDLFIVCPDCNGRGYVFQQGDPASLAGGTSETSGHKACEACKGKGGTITAAGEAVKEFVQLVNSGRV